MRSSTTRALAALVPTAALAATALLVPAAPASARVVAGTVEEPGGVALTWAPTYMAETHEYTQAQAVTAAQRFDLIAAMPVAFQRYTAAMRAANPDLTLLSYANSTMIAPAKAASLPESAFAHDVTGARVKVPDFGVYLMEPSNTVWRAAAEAECRARVQRGGYDGCLMDNLTLGIFSKGYVTGIPVKPGTGRPYTQAEYRDQMISLATYFKQAAPHLAHLGNSAENAYRYWSHEVTSQPIVKSQRGAQMEDFLRGAKDPVDEFPQGEEWLSNVAVVEDFEAAGVTGLFTTKLWVGATTEQVAKWQRFAMGTFLMAADGNSYLAFTRSRDEAGATQRNAPYAMPKEIGLPTSTMTRHSSGAYFRTFANGLSIVNPTPSTVTVELDAPMTTLNGQQTTTLTLGPSGADVLVGHGTPVDRGTPDTTRPTAQFAADGGEVRKEGQPFVLSGTAHDDTAVAQLKIGVRNEANQTWLRRDGSWGNYDEHDTVLAAPTAKNTAWSKQLSLPAGRYGVVAIAVDGASNENDPLAWTFFSVAAATGTSDLEAPVAALGAVTRAGAATRFSGTAQDNRLVRDVSLAIRNEATGTWLRRDGSWGAYQGRSATLSAPSTARTGWTLDVTLPAGRYGVSVVATDGFGNTNVERPWQLFTVG